MRGERSIRRRLRRGLGDDDARQDEQHGVGDEGEHLPEVMQRVFRLSGEESSAERPDGDAQDHARQHPRRRRLKLGDEEAEVTREERHGDLHDVIPRHGAETEPRVTARGDAHPHEHRAHRHPHEEREDLERRLVFPLGDLVEEGEDDDGGAVVDQGLALDDVTEPFRRSDLFEQRHDRDGVRGGQDGPEHQRRAPAPAVGQGGLEQAAHEEGPEEHAGSRQPEDLRRALPKRVPLQRERGLEHQRREEHREHGVRPDGHPYVERVGEHPEVEVRVREPYGEPHEEQRDGVGQPAVAHGTPRHRAETQRQEEEVQSLVRGVVVLLDVNSLAANGVGRRTRHGARASPPRR